MMRAAVLREERLQVREIAIPTPGKGINIQFGGGPQMFDWNEALEVEPPSSSGSSQSANQRSEQGVDMALFRKIHNGSVRHAVAIQTDCQRL